MSLAIWPLNCGIVSSFMKWDLKIEKAKEVKVEYLWIFILNNLNINSLNLNITWNKEIQSVLQYLIVSSLIFHILFIKSFLYFINSLFDIPLKYLKSGMLPI